MFSVPGIPRNLPRNAPMTQAKPFVGVSLLRALNLSIQTVETAIKGTGYTKLGDRFYPSSDFFCMLAFRSCLPPSAADEASAFRCSTVSFSSFAAVPTSSLAF